MVNNNLKDVLRRFIRAHLPELRESSLKTETDILEDFVNGHKKSPDSVRYSRNFLDKTPNPGYHLEKLKSAGAIVAGFNEKIAVLVDLAEEQGNKKTKRGFFQIRQVRELRADKMLQHAEEDSRVRSILFDVTGAVSIADAFTRITFSVNFGVERGNLVRYNQVVEEAHKQGIVTKEYDKLLWKNLAKPWKLDEDFIYYLRDEGVEVGS